MHSIMQDYQGRIGPLWIHISEGELIAASVCIAALSFILGLAVGVLVMAAL
jgi:hypothetical protein